MGSRQGIVPVIDGKLVSVVDTSTDSTTVYTGDGVIDGIYVNTALSAHTVVIKDGTTPMFTLPASLAAGAFIDFGGVEFLTGLVVDPDNLSTGSISVIYRPYN